MKFIKLCIAHLVGALSLVWLAATPGIAQSGNKILFDATKAQMASNADWVVDADAHNVGIGTGGIMQTGRGAESNPQRVPTPAQSSITSATTETFWDGALSAWALACARHGLTVETLPIGAALTFQNATNPQDLANYKVYVLDEPNIHFTMAERTAIINWVQAGGGLFIISDHANSDRNGDGIDSPAVLNELLASNGVRANPFGFSYELTYFSETSANYAQAGGSAILNGPAGRPAQIQISGGASILLDTSANRTARGLVFRSTYLRTGATGVLVAQASYGLGRVVGMSDSSPMEDGTGDPSDQLYAGWAEQNGDHARLVTNATLWLAGQTNDTLAVTTELARPAPMQARLSLWPNPARSTFEVIAPEQLASVSLANVDGRMVHKQRITQAETVRIENIALSPGVYAVQALGMSGATYWGRIVILK